MSTYIPEFIYILFRMHAAKESFCTHNLSTIKSNLVSIHEDEKIGGRIPFQKWQWLTASSDDICLFQTGRDVEGKYKYFSSASIAGPRFIK